MDPLRDQIMQVPERTSQAPGQEKSLEADLAAADGAIRSANLAQALAVLEDISQHLQVDPLVKKYIQTMKARALLNQSAALLQAHQAALAAVS
jgi:hypothetical protein